MFFSKHHVFDSVRFDSKKKKVVILIPTSQVANKRFTVKYRSVFNDKCIPNSTSFKIFNFESRILYGSDLT